MRELEVIKEVKTKDIIPYEKNPRVNKKAVDKVANSIQEFGFRNPIILDKDNVVICGHTRLKAAKKLKLKTVPCIIVDNLTEEQVKAYRLADNKVSEFAEWDMELLGMELEDIVGIDMSGFGFETAEFLEEKHEQEQEIVQGRVEGILNLDKYQFSGVGKYDIPEIMPVHSGDIGEITEWISFNYVLTDTEPEGKAVHFFIDDYQFERVWNNPDRYVERLKHYKAVLSPDFSPYGDMPQATQIFNHYRKHWVACYLQSKGVTIIPTVRASTDSRSFEWYLDGEPKGGVVCISSMWTNTEEEKKIFREEYTRMIEGLKPEKVYVYGKTYDFMKGDVEQIETFNERRWHNGKGN